MGSIMVIRLNVILDQMCCLFLNLRVGFLLVNIGPTLCTNSFYLCFSVCVFFSFFSDHFSPYYIQHQ